MFNVVALVVASRWRVHRGGLAMLALLVVVLGTVTMTSLAGARRAGSVLERARVEARSADLLVAGPPGTAVAITALPEVDVAAPLAMIFGEVEGAEFIIHADPTGVVGTAINRPHLVTGRLPDATVVEEIVLTEPTAAALDLGPGDRIRYRVVTAPGHAEPQAGVPAVLELLVVGITRDLDDAVAPSGARAYGSAAFARAMGQVPEQLDGYLVRLRPGVDVRTFEARARAAAPTVHLTVDDLSRELGKLREALDVLRIGLLVLGVVAGVAAAVVLALLIDRQVRLGTGMLATLAALGCGRVGRAIAAAAPVVPIAVAGSLAAGVLSVMCSPLASFGLTARVDPDVGLRIDVPVLAAGTALLTTLVVVAALAAGWRSVVAAGSPPRAGHARVSRRIPGVPLPPACAVGGRRALESETGQGLRPALVTAVVGVAGIAAAAVLGASLDRTVDTPDRHGRTWQAVLAYPPGPTPEAVDVFTHSTDVAAVGELRTGELIVDRTAIPALTLRPVVGAVGLRVVEGREPAAADEIVLGSATAHTLGVDVGDELSGLQLDDRKVRVVGRATFPGSGLSLIRDGAWLIPAAFDDLSVNRALPVLVLRWGEDADPVAAPARLEAALSGSRVIDDSAPPREVEDLARTSWVPWALGALLAALGVVSLLHALLTTVAHRGAELAVLRALGFRRAQVRTVLAAEALTMAAVGLGLGVPLGILAGRLSWRALAERLGVAPDPVIPLVGLAALFVLALSVAAACSSLPAWLALRQAPHRALRVE